MSIDKLFDGSDAHLLPGNADLIERLNEPEMYYPGNFDTVKRANAMLSGLCQEAADALAAADKRIEEERRKRWDAESGYNTIVERLYSSPVALMDTRAALFVCALREEDFPALYVLKGKRVRLVVEDDE